MRNVIQNGRKLSSLNATPNELLVTQEKISGQNELVHARNSEGRSGLIADTQVQEVKPGKTVL